VVLSAVVTVAGEVVTKCEVGRSRLKPGSDGRDGLWDLLTTPHSGLETARALPSHPPAVLTVPASSQTVPGQRQPPCKSNPISTGAFGIIRWPKMRKTPYEMSFFAFLMLFLNSGFYTIV